MLGLLRALVARRLVQDEQGALAVRPLLAADDEAQALGLDLVVGVVANLAVDPNQAGKNERRRNRAACRNLA